MYTKMAVGKDDSKAEIHSSDVGHSVVLSLLSIKIGIHFLLFFLSQDRPSTYQSKIKYLPTVFQCVSHSLKGLAYS